jgi:hypothetical protein
MFGVGHVVNFDGDCLLRAFQLRVEQVSHAGAADPVFHDDRPVLFVDEVEGVWCDVQAPGVASAPLLINLDVHLSLWVSMEVSGIRRA